VRRSVLEAKFRFFSLVAQPAIRSVFPLLLSSLSPHVRLASTEVVACATSSSPWFCSPLGLCLARGSFLLTGQDSQTRSSRWFFSRRAVFPFQAAPCRRVPPFLVSFFIILGGQFFSAQSFFSLREVLRPEPFGARKIYLGWCRFLPLVVQLSIPAARYLLWMYAESSPCRQFWLDFSSLLVQVLSLASCSRQLPIQSYRQSIFLSLLLFVLIGTAARPQSKEPTVVCYSFWRGLLQGEAGIALESPDQKTRGFLV
jgi:hypothetical protein